jgi:type IV secretory pathway ATPase VirB11/archaellum biosynthesis ATPase
MPSINFAKQTQEVFNMIFLIKNETLKNNQSKKLKYLLERAKKVFKFKRVSVDALMSIEDLYKKL